MNFVKVVQVLADAGVEFVIIGGWAAILNGSSYLTKDLDLCYSRRSENLHRLATALAPFHPRPRGFPAKLLFAWDEVTLRNGTIFTLSTDLGVIDLMAEVTGLGDFDHVRAGSILVEAFDRDVWTLDLPNLIKAKRAAGREKDSSHSPRAGRPA